MRKAVSIFFVALAGWVSVCMTSAGATEPRTITGGAKAISSEVVMVDNKFVRLVGYDAPSHGQSCDLAAEVRKLVSETSRAGTGVVIDGTKAHGQLVKLIGKGGLFCFVSPVEMKTPPAQPGDKVIRLSETSKIAFSGVCYRKFAGTFTCRSNLGPECDPSNGDRSINEEMIALGYGSTSWPFEYPPVNFARLKQAKRAAVKQGHPLAVAREKNQFVCRTFDKYKLKRRDNLPLPPNLDLNDLMDGK